ncbi:SDR family NAD(P)-dependent oxidoreductase [Nocardioides humi]|nr:SDR family NAD(P)-dependent oxidoreductase [Nocardioides humi]
MTSRVLVAGAASGIGAATAALFAERGHHLALADLSVDRLDETGAAVRALGGDPAVIGFDATDLRSCRELLAAATRHLGGVDAVVSTVGWTETHPFLEEEPEYWRRVVDVNLMGSINLTRAALEVMVPAGGGSIVLTASEAGKVGTVGETLYAAAKAGVIGFVKSVAREVARHGVRVNATAPGPTETPLLRAQADQDRVVDRTIRAVPMRRISTPDEQARALYFLATDEASYVTGQTLSVSGGLSMSS